MQCANTMALNKKMDEDEKREKALEQFQEESKYILMNISDSIGQLNDLKSSYKYDFSEDLEDMIKEIV